MAVAKQMHLPLFRSYNELTLIFPGYICIYSGPGINVVLLILGALAQTIEHAFVQSFCPILNSNLRAVRFSCKRDVTSRDIYVTRYGCVFKSVFCCKCNGGR